MFKKTHDRLYQWYQQNGRHELPWRQTDDPYKIYISEIMLQQTQVKTVLERFYFPFLEAFPTVEALANAKLDEVLKKWEGLGYYRRARNLHLAAQQVSPNIPRDIDALIAMPGIGRSTAHAIASFSYKTPVPILDANVKRILYRLFAKERANEKELWQMAYDFFDLRYPYEFNQALMDIGSALCGKKALCEECPLEPSCLGSDLNPLDYPAKKNIKKVPQRHTTLLIYKDGRKFGLRQRQGEFLHGLWGFEESDDFEASALHLGDVLQKYSHFHLYARVYLIEKKPKILSWFELQDLEDLALSGIDRKVLALLHNYDALRDDALHEAYS